MAPVNIKEETVGAPPPNAKRVLVTGFGVRLVDSIFYDRRSCLFLPQPFGRHLENPSWQAVKPLHNLIMNIETSVDPVFVQSAQTLPTQAPQNPAQVGQAMHPDDADSMPVDDDEEFVPGLQEVHITTLQIPVVYQDVIATVPGIHARPPVLPKSADAEVATPPNGFDFVLHVGVAGRGQLRVEQVAHKTQYKMVDAQGQYAPVVAHVHRPGEVAQEMHTPPAGVSQRRGRAQQDAVPVNTIGPRHATNVPPGVNVHVNGESAEPAPAAEIPVQPVLRGYSVGYEQLPDELPTEIDVASLIHSMKENGHTVSVPLSMWRPYLLTSVSIIASVLVDGRRTLSLRFSILWVPC